MARKNLKEVPQQVSPTKTVLNKSRGKIELVYADECYVILPGQAVKVHINTVIPKNIGLTVK